MYNNKSVVGDDNLGIFNFLLRMEDATGGLVDKNNDPYLDGIFKGSKIDDNYAWIKEIIRFLNQYLIPITIFLLALAAVFVIVLLFMTMKTDDPAKQKEFRKRMFQIAGTMLICLALVWLLGWLFSALPSIINAFKGPVMSGFESASGS